MIEKILPLTKNKIEILRIIYEEEKIHLLEISKILNLYPYSIQKTLISLKQILIKEKRGKTILLSLDKNISKYKELVTIIEDYRLSTNNKEVNSIIKQISNLFYEKNIVICSLFGSLARNIATKNSDIDLLLVVKRKEKNLKNKISQLSTLTEREINPLILSEKEFNELIKNKEPSIMSLKKPSQRLIIKGVNEFLENFDSS